MRQLNAIVCNIFWQEIPLIISHVREEIRNVLLLFYNLFSYVFSEHVILHANFYTQHFIAD